MGGVAKKFTERSTIADLALAMGELGVVDVHIGIAPGHVRPYRVAVVTRTSSVVGDGTTLAQAFDDALARSLHRDAARHFPDTEKT